MIQIDNMEMPKSCDVANCDLVVRDSFGSTTHDIQPEILTHYTGYFEVEL